MGTVSPLAGLDLHTGNVIVVVSDTHKSSDLIAPLQKLDERYSAGIQRRILLDNHSSHMSKELSATGRADHSYFDSLFIPKQDSRRPPLTPISADDCRISSRQLPATLYQPCVGGGDDCRISPRQARRRGPPPTRSRWSQRLNSYSPGKRGRRPPPTQSRWSQRLNSYAPGKRGRRPPPTQSRWRQRLNSYAPGKTRRASTDPESVEPATSSYSPGKRGRRPPPTQSRWRQRLNSYAPGKRGRRPPPTQSRWSRRLAATHLGNAAAALHRPRVGGASD